MKTVVFLISSQKKIFHKYNIYKKLFQVNIEIVYRRLKLFFMLYEDK